MRCPSALVYYKAWMALFRGTSWLHSGWWCMPFLQYDTRYWTMLWERKTFYRPIGVPGLLGDAWQAPKVGRCRVGYGMGRDVCSQPTRGSEGASWAPPAGSGQSPGRKRIILVYFEGHRTLIFVPIWRNLRGTICLIVPLLKILGDLSPCTPRLPGSTPMEMSCVCAYSSVQLDKSRV